MLDDKKPTSIPYRSKRKELHLTRPPRLEGVVKNAGINPVRKRKGPVPIVERSIEDRHRIPRSLARGG